MAACRDFWSWDGVDGCRAQETERKNELEENHVLDVNLDEQLCAVSVVEWPGLVWMYSKLG